MRVFEIGVTVFAFVTAYPQHSVLVTGAPQDLGDSRTCHTCRFTPLDGTCNHTQTCADSQGYCITQVSYTEDDSWVTRACSRLTICANSEENNPDECYWDDPTSYGFEGKCTFCCSGDNCNDDLPTNLLPHGQADVVERQPRAGPKPPSGSKPGGHIKPGGHTKPGGATKPKPGGTTKPKPGGNTKPKPGGTTRPKPGGTTKPKPGGNTKPKPGGTTRPKPGGTTKPKPGGNTKPKPGGTTRPKPGGTTRPKPGGTTKPKSGGTTRPKPGGTTKPNPSGTTRPKPGHTTRPKPNRPTRPRPTRPKRTTKSPTQAPTPPATKARTNPPATNPPATNPPATQPPVTNPPSPSTIQQASTGHNSHWHHHRHSGGNSHGLGGSSHGLGGNSHGLGGNSHGLGGTSHGSGGYGGPCHSHGGVPCCGSHSGDRSIDVSVHVHIGRNQLKGLSYSSQKNSSSQGSVLALTTLAPTNPTPVKVSATNNANPTTATAGSSPTTIMPSTSTTIAPTTSSLTTAPSTRPKVTATTTAQATPSTPSTPSTVQTSPTRAKITATKASSRPKVTATTTAGPQTSSTSSSRQPSTSTQSTSTSSPASATTTTLVNPGTNQKPHECYVCNDPLCTTQTLKKCGQNTPYCMSTVVQINNGSRTFSKGCIGLNECEAKWWRTTIWKDFCMLHMDDSPSGPTNQPTNCTYCCTTSACNEHVKPTDTKSLYIGKKLPPKPANVNG